MQRLRRISKLIANLSLSHETKASLKVIQMIFFLGLCLHLISCIFRYIVFQKDHPVWVPPVDFVWAETKIFQEDILQQYVATFYHALMIFGLNEVAPV